MISPRNDFVLIRISERERLGGVHVPGISQEAKLYHVEGLGPKVEGLRVGDRVLMTGTQGVDWSYVPGHPSLLVIREGNVVLVFGPESEEPAPVPADWSQR